VCTGGGAMRWARSTATSPACASRRASIRDLPSHAPRSCSGARAPGVHK
jgi:hypothetical protein